MDSIINFFITPAYADTATNAQGGGASFFIMFAVFFLFIYFAVWRPQSKRAKEQQNLLGSLAKGDEVIAAGGVLGRITKLNEQYLVLSVANGTDIIIQKSSIMTVLPKGTLKSLE